MARAKETYGKKEVRNKKLKKRKDKEQRKLEKKEQGKQSFDDMIAFVDENGNLTSTPQDLSKRVEVDVNSIEIGIPKRDDSQNNFLKQGRVSNYDDSKGFGFIVDADTKESLFFHINDCIEEVKPGNMVEFETEKGLKGLKATNVKLKK